MLMNFSQMGTPNKDVFLTQDETNILVEAEKTVKSLQGFLSLFQIRTLPIPHKKQKN